MVKTLYSILHRSLDLTYSREENVMLHLLYLHDDQENCFIYNFVDDNVWKINHLLMEQ